MARPSIVLMSAGGAALLVGLVLLWRSTQVDALPTEPTRPAETASGTEPPAAAPATPAARPAARVGKSGTPPAAPPSRGTPGPVPSLAPAPEVTESDDPSSNHDNIHFGGAQLRAQHAAVEPLVRECVANAVAAGLRPTGQAILTYIVAKHGDKYEIEDTSYDAEKTTLKNQELIDCLHQTAKAMKFVGLPRRSKALVVTRSVTLENGKIGEYKHVTFSYLR